MTPRSSWRHQQGPLSNWPCRRMLQAVGHSLNTFLISVCPLALLWTRFNILTCYLHFSLTNKNQHRVLMLCYFFPLRLKTRCITKSNFCCQQWVWFLPGRGGQLADYVVLIFMTVGLREIRSWCKLFSDTFIQCFFAFCKLFNLFSLLLPQVMEHLSGKQCVFVTHGIVYWLFEKLVTVSFSFSLPVVIFFTFYFWIVNSS